MSEVKEKQVYLNEKQQKFLLGRQKTKVLIGGRGVGKTFILGGVEYINVKKLPRGRGFLSSTTFSQLATKSIPEMQAFWMSVGLAEHIDDTSPGNYVIGRKPPKYFMTPYKKPKDYKNIISFFNGYTLELLSMDRPDISRGGSYDCGSIDEAALVAKEHIDKVLLPSIRGNRHRFKSVFHQQLRLVSSMPWKATGRYLFDYEEKALEHPEKYLYLEATAYDNIAVLGEAGIQRLKDEMDPYIFEVEVMNAKVDAVMDGFYHKFNDRIHTFIPKYRYNTTEIGLDQVVGIWDVNSKGLFDLTWDFGGSFNGVIVFQEKNNTEKGLDSLFVKNGKSVLDLVDLFCDKYRDHQHKFVRLWGEPRGNDRQALGDTIYISIQKRFKRNGWNAEIKAPGGRTDTHEQRYIFVNKLLEESSLRLPRLRLNEDACKNVIVALQLAEAKDDFKKDKSNEKNKAFPQEKATHFTDMIDYYLKQKHGHKEYDVDMGAGTVVFG